MSTDTQDTPAGRRRWTTAEERQLEQLWREGLSVVCIAVRMGRTARAVGNRLRRRGLSVPGQRRRGDARPATPARTPSARRREIPEPERTIDVAAYACATWAPRASPGHGLRWAWRARVGDAEVTGATVGDLACAVDQANAAADRLLAVHRGRGRSLRAWHGAPEMASDGGVK